MCNTSSSTTISSRQLVTVSSSATPSSPADTSELRERCESGGIGIFLGSGEFWKDDHAYAEVAGGDGESTFDRPPPRPPPPPPPPPPFLVPPPFHPFFDSRLPSSLWLRAPRPLRPPFSRLLASVFLRPELADLLLGSRLGVDDVMALSSVPPPLPPPPRVGPPRGPLPFPLSFARLVLLRPSPSPPPPLSLAPGVDIAVEVGRDGVGERGGAGENIEDLDSLSGLSIERNFFRNRSCSAATLRRVTEGGAGEEAYCCCC